MSSNEKLKFAFVFLCAFLPTYCLSATEPDCPMMVEYEVSVSSSPSGWNGGFRPGFYSDTPPKTIKRTASFSNAILYFEGNVEDRVELKGNTGTKYKGKNADIVYLEAEKEYSVECLYSEGVMLWKKLPMGLKQCVHIESKGKGNFQAFCF